MFSKNFPFFGLVLIVLGMLMLLQTLGYIDESLWRYFWPIIVIIIGLKISAGEIKK